MSEKGIHYLALAKAKRRLEETSVEFDEVSQQLQEAIKMGDLRENSEYDAAMEARGRVRREREILLPVLTMPVLKSADSVNVFEEGCVVRLKVYGTSPRPLDPSSQEFKQWIESNNPQFEGTVLLGGTLPIHELLVDAALDAETPVGSYLLGKTSGNYSIQVPGGFAVVSAQKLRSTEFAPEDIGCTYNEGA